MFEQLYVSETKWEPIAESILRDKLVGWYKNVDEVIQAIRDAGLDCIIRTPTTLYRYRA
jgi:hypothetical protein